MQTKPLHIYETPPPGSVSNEYPTLAHAFREPSLHMVVGVRNSGKSYLTARLLQQARKDKTFDRVYMVTPSFDSNKAYFAQHVKPEDVFEPTRDSIDKVIAAVEADRDAWERFVEEKRQYKLFQRAMQGHGDLKDDALLYAYALGWLDGCAPKWKYAVEQPPRSMLVLDDVLSRPAIQQSSGLGRIATLNRHVAPLKENFVGPHGERSSCGLSVVILSQTYRMIGGVSRLLRENLSLLTLFQNKQEKQLAAIREELANVVDENLFDKAYEYATKEKHGALTVDFRPKCPSLTFRKNLSEAIVFSELGCTCKK